MPRAKYYYKTPLGDFPSAIAAAKALKCDRATVQSRCVNDPENYKKIKVEPSPQTAAKWRTKWPLTWREYIALDNEQREQIFTMWALDRRLDPNAESTVDQFFDEMDHINEYQPEADDEELELD